MPVGDFTLFLDSGQHLRQPRFAVLVPAHCTGWRAQHAMAARFGEAFVPNSIGTRFTF